MNYMYQSIAHNLITVTDPDDDSPSSGKTCARSPTMAVSAASVLAGGWSQPPIDLNDWLDQRDLYHTGTMQRYFEGTTVLSPSLTSPPPTPTAGRLRGIFPPHAAR